MRPILCGALLLLPACTDMEASDEVVSRSLNALGRAPRQRPASPSISPAAAGGSSLAHRAFLKVSIDLNAEFGYPIAIDRNTMVVGAPLMGVFADSDGAVFLFARRGGVWSQEAILVPPYQEAGDGNRFGTSLSIQGDVIAVGAPRQGNGAVHIYQRSGAAWTRTAVLRPSFDGPDLSAEFGLAVSLDGDRLAIGSRGDMSASTGIGGDPTNQDAPYSGAAYVYVRDRSGWALEAYIKPSNTTADHGFGGALALSGNTLAVASGDDSSATGVNGDQTNTDSPFSGAVFVFERGADGWGQQAYVKASNTGAGDNFGSTFSPNHGIALSGDTLAVAAAREDSAATGVGGDESSNAAPDSGAVYVFTRSGGTWAQEAYIKASNTGAGDLFGTKLALHGDTLAISAPLEDGSATDIDGDQASDAAPDAGAVYLFERCDGWAQTHYVKAFNTNAGDIFGWGLAWDSRFLAVGASGQYTCPEPDPDDLCRQFGAVYVLR